MTLTQRDVAQRLINRSARLLRLIDLSAPQVIIERERRLISDALEAWPVLDKLAHVEANQS